MNYFCVFTYFIFLVAFKSSLPTSQNDISREYFRETYISFVLTRVATPFLPLEQIPSASIVINDIDETHEMSCIENICRFDMILDKFFGDSPYTENFLIKLNTLIIVSGGKYMFGPQQEINVDVPPNSVFSKSFHINDNEMQIKIIYRCQGYKNRNCKDKMSEEELKAIQISKPKCKGSSQCQDQECDDSYCQNGGKCFIKMFNPSEKYCMCPEKYYGNKCQLILNDITMTEDMILFYPLENFRSMKTILNTCAECKNNLCYQYGDIKVCNEIPDEYKNCQENCHEVCGIDVCLKTKSDGAKIYYLNDQKKSR